MKKLLIVGQGIAGTVLGHTLELQGVLPLVMDEAKSGPSCSEVAMGLVNPITGKRFAKSWMYDTLYPFARSFYLEFGKSFQLSAWEDCRIDRILSDAMHINNWSSRCHWDDMAPYMRAVSTESNWDPYTLSPSGYGHIVQAGRVHMGKIIEAYRKHLLANGRWLEGPWNHHHTGDCFSHFDAVVFCEGYKGKDNPLFSWLPWELSKGQAMLVRFDSPTTLPLTVVLKKKLVVAAWENGQFWVGSSHLREYESEYPDIETQKELADELGLMVNLPYIFCENRAGIRPCVADRRPFLGVSKERSTAYLFNGLGTKGGLLAPYWAQHFTDFLLQDKALDIQVDIRRFTD